MNANAFDRDSTDGPASKSYDYGEYFETDQLFPSRDDMIQWAMAAGRKVGIVVLVLRSDSGGNGKNTNRREFITLGCERSGVYRPHRRLITEQHSEKDKRASGTKKIGCPFRLRGRPLSNDAGWRLTVKCGIHNHEKADTLIGHPYPGRLKPEEKKLVEDMTKINVKPGKILHTLKERDADNVTTIKGIYNARFAYNRSIRGSRTEMQQLMFMLEKLGFHHCHRTEDGSDVVKDIFWAYKQSIRLFHTFPTVILIDATYKTCKYRLPLVDIVGVTSTNLSFSIGYAFVDGERKDNYVWTLQCLKDLIVHEDGYPRVIITDRDLALTNAIRVVFPEAKHLLCQYHIEKCVQTKAKLLVPKKDVWKKIAIAWENIVDASTEEVYEWRVKELDTLCHTFWDFREYCHATWLAPHKEQFVHAWVDRVMHLGNTTTNRVEGNHGKLKRLLIDSQGDFCRALDRMHELIRHQNNEIFASFEASKILTDHRFNVKLYSQLRGLVSRHCLQEIHSEHQRSIDISASSQSICGCTIRTTHGIPCACQISKWDVIPLDQIHSHWRRLTLQGEVNQGAEESDQRIRLRAEIDGLWERFDAMDLAGQNSVVVQVSQIGHPETTSMKPPTQRTINKETMTRKAWKKQKSNKRDPSFFEVVDSQASTCTSDRPATQGSKSKKGKVFLFADQIPDIFHPFIDEVINVAPDGNCGFRVVAQHMWQTEDNWPVVRAQCHQELQLNKDLYIAMWGDLRWYHLLDTCIADPSCHFQPINKWMSLPDMGYVVANLYKLPVVSISQVGSCTILPLMSGVLSEDLICIGFVNGNHFITVRLKDGSPLPPIEPQWSHFCNQDGARWQQWHANRNLTYVSRKGIP